MGASVKKSLIYTTPVLGESLIAKKSFKEAKRFSQVKEEAPISSGVDTTAILKKRREGQVLAGKRRGFRSTLLSSTGETAATAKHTLLGQ